MSDPTNHPLVAAHYDPDDVGIAGRNQREALLQALGAVSQGAPVSEIVRLYGGYALAQAKLIWVSLHLRPDELESRALALLSHELRCAPKASTRVAAAKAMLSHVQRKREMQRRYDDEVLSDVAQRQRAEEEFRRPSQLLQDLIVDVWCNEHPRPPVEPLLLRLLRGCEDLIRSEGWIRIEEAHEYAAGTPAPTVVSPVSQDDEFEAQEAILESILGGTEE